MTQVRVVKVDAIPTAVIRRRVQPSELSRVVPADCGTVWKFLRDRGLKGGRNVALYVNGEMDIEVGVELASTFEPAHGIVPSALPAGTVVTTTHFGPYQQMGAAHRAIADWCKANGRRTGASWEIYGHWKEEWNQNPHLIRTDLHYLLIDS